MSLDINKYDEIWTADSKKLGIAQRIYHRQGEANPELQLYESYLRVENFEYGEGFYIPTDFVSGKDPDSGKLVLSIPFKQVMDMTYFRMPDFVVHKRYELEALPSG